jgi:putative transcriptional regulator|tara:strand:+ start:28 stop:549 length:522 start_codon:yes stop_codon:yes gene_type:complete
MSRVGKLLIAHPKFPSDSPFTRTVIYVYQDDEVNGTVGVVLNKPSRTSVSIMCDTHDIMYPDTLPMLHLGGPVNMSALLLLHTDEWNSSNTACAGNSYRISSDNHMFLKMSTGNEPIYWRAFSGYVSWQPGQLALEDWLTIDASDALLFECNGEDQWIAALDTCSQQTIDHFF